MARVGAATALTALCGYAVLYLAARDLEPAGFSVFGVFWGAFGLVTGAAFGLLQEATREVRSAGYAEIVAGPRTHPMRVAALVGVAAAGADRRQFAAVVWPRVRRVAVAFGRAAGGRVSPASACTPRCWACWPGWTGGPRYGSLMVTDAGMRMIVAVATFLVGWGLAGYLWATVAGAIAWLIMLIVSPATRACRQAADARRHSHVPARGVAFDRRRRRECRARDGLSGAAQGDIG